MKRKTKVVGLLLGIFMTQVLVAGCGNTSDNTKDSRNDQIGNQIEDMELDQDIEPSPINTEENLPIVKEKTSFYFMGMDMSPNMTKKDDSDFMKKLEKETGIHIEWEIIPQTSWTEKKNLAIASGKLPDAFYGIKALTSEEVQKFGADGTIIKLDQLIRQYAPNIQRVLAEDKFFDQVTRSMDGNIYALAEYEQLGFDSYSTAVIKKKWLDNLGLTMPKTTEEFYEVLKAFREQDPNRNGKRDEIPFSFLYIENPINREVKREHYWIFAAFGMNDSPMHMYVQDNGELIFTANQARWKEAIQYLHRLYKEELIDPEVFTQDRKLLTSKVKNNKNIGAYTDFRLKWSFVLEQDWDDYEVLPPLKGPYGDQSWNRAIVGMSEGSFAITNQCENPDILMKWINYTLEPENAIQMQYGMFQEDESKFSEQRYLIPSTKVEGKWITNDQYKPHQEDTNDWPFSSPIATVFTIITKDIYDQYIDTKLSVSAKQEDCEVYRPYLTKYPYNMPYKFSAEEIEELNQIQPELLNYIYKKQAQWIVEGNIDAQWDNYLKQLKKLGVDRYIEIYKNAYERIK